MTSGFAVLGQLARTAPPHTRSTPATNDQPARHVFLGSRFRLRLPSHPPHDVAVAIDLWLVPSTSTGDSHPRAAGHAGRTNDRRAEPGTPSGQQPGRPHTAVTPKSTGVPSWLSSSFGGDLRASTVANRLLSRMFCDDIRVPELAHISPRGEHDAIRAHRARHPCVVGRPPLARTRSRHKAQHGARVGRVRILRACPHGDQEPSARRPPNLPADGFCSKCPAHAEKPKNGSIESEARLIDPCNASAHQGPAHGDGLRRPTGESSHRSSRHHGAASMPLDPPPGTDPPRGWPPSSPDSPPNDEESPQMRLSRPVSR